ncbi:MAG: excalibur calcium-binding domain-containing protein [Gordonia sp. (in: high G+C Gram-positive bacteria)]|uniref:excalibur calcium-binding domain-containing protein n=1 Tax=Gordonia sp. (in: high G+C Gram-positive bacteria) TaxID=84139 RepID=UPI0039E6B65C
MKKTLSVLTASVALGGSMMFVAAAPSDAAPIKYKNCTALNKDYRHGVGRPGARDHVTGRTRPVKNFRVNKALYNRNSHLDRDKDGIACEKK